MQVVFSTSTRARWLVGRRILRVDFPLSDGVTQSAASRILMPLLCESAFVTSQRELPHGALTPQRALLPRVVVLSNQTLEGRASQPASQRTKDLDRLAQRVNRVQAQDVDGLHKRQGETCPFFSQLNSNRFAACDPARVSSQYMRLHNCTAGGSNSRGLKIYLRSERNGSLGLECDRSFSSPPKLVDEPYSQRAVVINFSLKKGAPL